MKIWLINNYCTLPQHGSLPRTYYFGKCLHDMGHEPVLFIGSHPHNTQMQLINDRSPYKFVQDACYPCVYVKTNNYEGSKIKRVMSMFEFYFNAKKAAKEAYEKFGKPDVILGSSAHPLAPVLAIQCAKKYGIKAIAEVRDLWPESIVAYGVASKHNPIVTLLYKLEKWIYTKADSIIFTMEGGRDYIIEKGWDKQTHGGPVDLDKVHHINNGVDLEMFDYNREHYRFDDADLDDPDTKKIVYTGSIRKANISIQVLPAVAQILMCQGIKAKILVYGKGDYLGVMQQKCKDEQLDNIVFKGSVEKKYIPYVLSKSDLNILNCDSSEMSKYGSSQNKLFEYLASGQPILSGESDMYSLIRRYGCGISKHFDSAQEIAQSMIEILRGDVDITDARHLAQKYDFKVLTGNLVEIIGGNHG